MYMCEQLHTFSLHIHSIHMCIYIRPLYVYMNTLSIHLYSSGIMALYSLISQHVFPRVILMYNHSTTIVVKKLNIHTRSLSNLQSVFKFYQLAQ